MIFARCGNGQCSHIHSDVATVMEFLFSDERWLMRASCLFCILFSDDSWVCELFCYDSADWLLCWRLVTANRCARTVLLALARFICELIA